MAEAAKAGDVASAGSKRTLEDDREEQVRADLARAEAELNEAKMALKKAEARWEAKGMPEEGIFAEAYRSAMQRVSTAQQRVNTLTDDLVAERAAKRARQGGPAPRPSQDHLPEALRVAVGEPLEWRTAAEDDPVHAFVDALRAIEIEGLQQQFDEAKGDEEMVLSVPLPCWPFFGESKPGALFLRRESFEVWCHAWQERRRSRGSSDEGHKVVVTGNSGIGKSRSMTLCVALALQDHRAVVYEDRENSRAFAFLWDAERGRYDVWRAEWSSSSRPGDPLEKLAARHDLDTVTFVDTDNHTRAGLDLRYTVKTKGTAYLATSPALDRVHSFTAGGDKPGGVLYMAPWTLTGLASLHRLFQRHGFRTDLGETEAEVGAEIERRVSRVGSAPRDVMTRRAYDRRLEEAETALTSVSAEQAVLFMTSGQVKGKNAPGALFGWHRRPGVEADDENRFRRSGFRMQPLSPWIAGRVAGQYADHIVRRRVGGV